jgi:hypothetical protein
MKFIPPFTDNKELDYFLSDLSRYVSDLPTSVGGDVTIDVTGTVATYTYTKRYLHIKYADSTGGASFSDLPTNKHYFGLFNSDSSTESVDWFDYAWTPVDATDPAADFGTTKFLYYKLLGGRQIKLTINTVPPDSSWSAVPSGSIDLDTIVPNNSITNAQLAPMAEGTIKGRISTGAGNPEDLTGTQVTTMLDEFDVSLKGLVPAPTAGDVTGNKLLRADGSWVVPPVPVSTLDGLSDVVITTPAVNQILKYDGTNWVNGSGGSGGGTSKVLVTGLSLGSIPSSIANAFTYVTVPSVCNRGLITKFVLTMSVLAPTEILIRGAGNDGGTKYLEVLNWARGLSYTITLPFYYENDSTGDSLFIGIRNRFGSPRTFTLTELRVEKFA